MAVHLPSSPAGQLSCNGPDKTRLWVCCQCGRRNVYSRWATSCTELLADIPEFRDQLDCFHDRCLRCVWKWSDHPPGVENTAAESTTVGAAVENSDNEEFFDADVGASTPMPRMKDILHTPRSDSSSDRSMSTCPEEWPYTSLAHVSNPAADYGEIHDSVADSVHGPKDHAQVERDQQEPAYSASMAQFNDHDEDMTKNPTNILEDNNSTFNPDVTGTSSTPKTESTLSRLGNNYAKAASSSLRRAFSVPKSLSAAAAAVAGAGVSGHQQRRRKDRKSESGFSVGALRGTWFS